MDHRYYKAHTDRYTKWMDGWMCVCVSVCMYVCMYEWMVRGIDRFGSILRPLQIDS